MELVDVALTELARRSRALVVHHTSTHLTRGLEVDEEVVLRDGSGEFFAGRVEDVDFELEDTIYRIAVGVRLPEELALARLGVGAAREPAEGEGGPVDMDRLVELLGEARRARADKSIPPEAARATSRTLRNNVGL